MKMSTKALIALLIYYVHLCTRGHVSSQSIVSPFKDSSKGLKTIQSASSLRDHSTVHARGQSALNRNRRSSTFWSISSFPSSSDPEIILRDFGTRYRSWGEEALSASFSHCSRCPGPSLAVHYPRGSYTKTTGIRGAGFYSKPSGVGDADSLILKYDVYFDNFGFGKGGKLPGLFGGEDGAGAYACSGHHNPPTCFSLRLMWRTSGMAEVYAYIPDNQAPGFKDRNDVIYHATSGQSLGRGQVNFVNNKWHTVTMETHLNEVGQTNGYIKLCVNVHGGSEQCYTAANLRMRNSSSHFLRGVIFSTFFGGSSSDYAAPNDCYTYYKNFKLSKVDYAPMPVSIG